MNALIHEALAYAIKRHAGQTRSGDSNLPYVLHPLQVAQIVLQAGFDDSAAVIALLHDVVEDTFPATDAGMAAGIAEISHLFGEECASVVWHLTLPLAVRGNKESKLEYQKAAMALMPVVGIAVKISDKEDNVGSLIVNPPSWGRNAKIGYANGALEVVKAAAACPDERVQRLISNFTKTHGEVVANITRS